MAPWPPPFDTKNVILTGIARSGTTLACTLLNRLPDTVALHEPMSPKMLLGLSLPEGVTDRVAGFFAAQRRTLLERGEAVSRGIDGKIPDNSYAATPGPNGLRASVVREGIVHFEKPLARSFRLVIKHPGCFTALLGALRQRFPCHAIVRNPLAILLSWQTTEANSNNGRQPAAEIFDDDLRHRLDAEPDPLGRQLAMLSWSFGQYARHLPAEAVIRYEDLIATGGRRLRGSPLPPGRSSSRSTAAMPTRSMAASMSRRSPVAFWPQVGRSGTSIPATLSENSSTSSRRREAERQARTLAADTLSTDCPASCPASLRHHRGTPPR